MKFISPPLPPIITQMMVKGNNYTVCSTHGRYIWDFSYIIIVRRGLCDPLFFFLRRALCAVQSSCTVLFRCARSTHALHASSYTVCSTCTYLNACQKLHILRNRERIMEKFLKIFPHWSNKLSHLHRLESRKDNTKISISISTSQYCPPQSTKSNVAKTN